MNIVFHVLQGPDPNPTKAGINVPVIPLAFVPGLTLLGLKW